jgi:hypothetical protein
MLLAGCEFVRIMIDATSAGNALSMHAGVSVNMKRCQDYYIKKWGGLPPNEKYEQPAI